MESIEDRVCKLARSQCRVPRPRVVRESTFASLGFDSLALIEFVMDVEDEFDVSIPDEVVEPMTTVGQMIEHLRRPRPL